MTQSSIAVSSDGVRWFLLNVSPDVRQQITAFPALTPPGTSPRGSGIAACVLTDAELDHTAGLLFLREGTLFQMYSTPVVRRWLKEKFPVEPMLSAFRPRPWTEIALDGSVDLTDADGVASSLRITALDLPAHPPLYVGEWTESAAGSVIALVVEDRDTGKRLLYAPGVESITPELDAAAETADAILFDGTFWSLNEMVDHDLSDRNALDMGHLPIHGDNGTLDWFQRKPAAHKYFFHINNTNPILNRTSSERKTVENAGIGVAFDGLALTL